MKKILDLLYKNEFLIINDIRFRLSKYNKYMNLFKIEFEKNKRQNNFYCDNWTTRFGEIWKGKKKLPK